MNKEFIDLHYPKAEVVIVEERSNFASFMDKLESEEIVTPKFPVEEKTNFAQFMDEMKEPLDHDKDLFTKITDKKPKINVKIG